MAGIVVLVIRAARRGWRDERRAQALANWLPAYAFLYIVFLYLPVLLLPIFSVNTVGRRRASRSPASPLKWYAGPAEDAGAASTPPGTA